MRKKFHLNSIRLKKKLRLNGVLILFFFFASIFPILVANLHNNVVKFTEKDQLLYEENLVSSDQGEEIFKLIFGTEAGPDNLDPQNSWKPNSFDVINQVCEGLFTINLTDPNLSIIPNLATSMGTWVVNSTDTWYTLSLRPNVSFHDGTKFNATAVKFTFDRLAYLINNSMAMAGQLYEYYDPDAEISYPIINKTVIIDEYIVRFELNKPYGPFEALLCFPGSYILSPTSTPQFDLIDTFTGDLIGTGPFVYDHYLPDKEVLFHAFEDYWAGRANTTILKFALTSDMDISYEKIYSFTTQGEANDGTWDYWNTDIGDHSVATKDTYQYWCWTDTGTISSNTGPPSGTACIYPETSSPTAVGDVYIATLANTEVIDAANYGLNVTFNTCMRGNSAGHMYFEYWDGDSWEIKDDWPGDAVNTFTIQGPYDFSALENSDFKIRFRVVVGGINYENDFTFDEVRIYGYSKNRNEALLSGEVDIITDPDVSMFSTFSADPDITLNDAGLGTTAQFLSMNNRRINGTFRKAISYAINYSNIINELNESPAERLKSPLLENLLFANWSLDVAAYNVTKAREAMQSIGFGAGWNTTYPGPSEANWLSASFATFNYSYNFGNIFRENLLILLQDNLDKIGIEVTDAGMSDSEFANILYQRGGYTWDMLELCWLDFSMDYNDPDNPINILFTNRTTSFNTAFYDGYLAAAESSRNPFNLWDNVQLLMEAALFETNQSIRKPYYDRIQQILVEEDMPWAFGVVSHNYDAYRSHIIGFQSNSIGKLSFYGVTQNSSIAPQTIYLNGNQEWQFFRNANKCTGQGTFSDPYVVEDLVINAGGMGSAIRIENSDVYFIIENCTVYNSESAGIRLYNVDNGDILNNTANNDSFLGIVLIDSNYNNITGNNASSNTMGGIYLSSSDYNLIFENIVNSNDAYGIGLESCNNNTILNNTATQNSDYGIGLINGHDNFIIENNVNNNYEGGIGLTESNYNLVLNSTANNNGNYGISLGDSIYNNISLNIVNNNKFSGINLDNSNDNDIWDNTVNNNTQYGIQLAYCDYNTVMGNTVDNNNQHGIYLVYCDYNTVSGNTVNNNTQYGIRLGYCDYNTVSGNTVNNNNQHGIYLVYCDYNTVSGNTVNNNNQHGIYLVYCYYNTVSGSTVNNNTQYGIYLSSCNRNDILGNNITNNYYGVYLLYGYRNYILSNTISNNTYGIYSLNSRCNEVSPNSFSGNIQDIYGNPENCPPPEYYNPGLTNIIGTVISIIVIIVICGICGMIGRSKGRMRIKQSTPINKLSVRLKTTEIAPREKGRPFEIEPEPVLQVEVEEIVPPKVAPVPIPPADVEEVVVPPKATPKPIPPPDVEEEMVPSKAILEPIPPVEVEDVVVPPKATPKPIPPEDIVEEISIEKVEIGKVARVFEGHGKGINSVAFSPDGNYVVSASNDKTIKIWEISTGKLLKTLEGHKKSVTSIAISSDGKYIVSGSKDNTVKIWDICTGELIRTLRGHTWFVTTIAVSPESNYIISGSFDNDIKIWDTSTGDIVRTLEGHKNEVRSVAISLDSEHIASASIDRTLKIWSLETGQIVRTIDVQRKHINSVVFSPDREHIFGGLKDKTIREWNIATGKLVRTFKGHTWDVLTVAISLDGNYMVSGSYNREIKVWDLTTNDLIRTFKGHKREVNSVAISPDGKYIVSGSNDKTIKIWKYL